jgi:Fe-S cluster assembly ATP-binding protein
LPDAHGKWEGQMLEIRDLHATVDGVEILKGVDLTVRAGETHAIMGPNGSGKSTLAYVLAGHSAYTVTRGTVAYEGEDLLALEPEERARRGVFLSFQHPIEIPGVRMDHFLRAGYNEVRKSHGEEEMDVLKFDRLIRNKVKVVEMEPALTKRSVNAGFSGGEKKRNEILQMAVLEPKLRILDEIDSGLDVDALRSVSAGIKQTGGPETATVIVTHYQRLLDYLVPDRVHVLMDGRIVRSGGKELAQEVEAKGYEGFAGATGAASRES